MLTRKLINVAKKKKNVYTYKMLGRLQNSNSPIEGLI